MPSGRSRRPSVISDDEFSETAQTIIKRHKKATVEEIYENLDFCDMSRDEVRDTNQYIAEQYIAAIY